MFHSVNLPPQRLRLITSAFDSRELETGFAPLADKKRPCAVLADASAEAWGNYEHRGVAVYYYPERRLADDTAVLV